MKRTRFRRLFRLMAIVLLLRLMVLRVPAQTTLTPRLQESVVMRQTQADKHVGAREKFGLFHAKVAWEIISS